MSVSKSPVRIENNVLTALSFPREAHKSFNIQHMKLHSFPNYSPDSQHTYCLLGCDSTSGISTIRSQNTPTTEEQRMIYNHSLSALSESQCLLGRPWSAC